MDDQAIQRRTAPTLWSNAVYNQNTIDRWTKGCILPFHKKGVLRLAKNYRGETLTSIAVVMYNALLRDRIEPKIENILRKNRNGFRSNRSKTSQVLNIGRILEVEIFWIWYGYRKYFVVFNVLLSTTGMFVLSAFLWRCWIDCIIF